MRFSEISEGPGGFATHQHLRHYVLAKAVFPMAWNLEDVDVVGTRRMMPDSHLGNTGDLISRS